MTTALRPRSLDEALQLRAAHPEALPVAGGTDVMVGLNGGSLQPPALLDLSRVEELRDWRRENGSIFVGAGVTFARIECELTAFTALVEAARSLGSRQVRNRATLGGNVATASPAGDGIAVLAAYDADVVLSSADRTRRVRWDEFVLGPKRTSLEPDELVVGVEWRVAAGPGSFAKVGPRQAVVIAVAGVCVQLDGAGAARIALGSVGPTVIRAREAEWLAAAGAAPREVGAAAAAEARPIDDVRGSAAYRRTAVAVLVRRALECARKEERC